MEGLRQSMDKIIFHHHLSERRVTSRILILQIYELHLKRMTNNLNLFPSSFLDSSNANNVGASPRIPPSSSQQQASNANGMNGMPMLAGQQMDVNNLYQKICELSDVLRENREKTKGIIKTAEDLAVSNAIASRV